MKIWHRVRLFWLASSIRVAEDQIARLQKDIPEMYREKVRLQSE